MVSRYRKHVKELAQKLIEDGAIPLARWIGLPVSEQWELLSLAKKHGFYLRGDYEVRELRAEKLR